MNEQQLQELALQVKQHPQGTTARRIALSKLIDGIYKIYKENKLFHPYTGRFKKKVYEDIYDEAVQNLFLYICKNIDKYDPQRATIITWINMLLSQRFFKEAIPKIIGKANEINLESLEHLEDLTSNNSDSENNYISACLKIRRYIENDPNGTFREAQMKKYPQVNFKEIAIKRVSGISWQQISSELNIPIATLSTFYQRTLKKVRDELRNICDLEDLI